MTFIDPNLVKKYAQNSPESLLTTRWNKSIEFRLTINGSEHDSVV